MMRRPPRSTRTDPLFPYTTLYARVRSDRQLCRTLVAVDLADTHRDQRSPGPRAGGTAPAQAARRDVGRRSQRLSEQLDAWFDAGSSEERRVGKGWVSTCGSRWTPYH